jgi:hypothetical protein
MAGHQINLVPGYFTKGAGMDKYTANKFISYAIMAIIAYYILGFIVPYLIWGVMAMVIWRVYNETKKK